MTLKQVKVKKNASSEVFWPFCDVINQFIIFQTALHALLAATCRLTDLE